MPVADFDTVGWWLESIDDVPDAGYRDVGLAGLDGEVRAGSQLWCDDHLAAEASPYVGGRKVRTSVHAGNEGTDTRKVSIDLVRHGYEIDELPVEVVEARSFTLIRLAAGKALQGTASARAAEIQRLARRLLSQPWVFRFPASIDEGVRFSSNPDVDPDNLPSWTARGDGGIRGGRLWFLCFRKVPDIIGYWSDIQWFPDEFREKLK
jgi:hypothetical protein